MNSPPNSGPPPTPDPIDFRDRNAVERLLEGKKFRRCINLRCESVSHPNMQMLYMPVCLEGRFAKEGVAEHFELPLPTRPLSPVTYRMIPTWAPLIGCPPDCKGYRNRTVARVRALFKRRRHVEGSVESTPKEERRKWWIGVIFVPIAAVILGAILGWLTPEGRRLLRLDKPKPDAAPSTQGVPPQTAPRSPPAPQHAKSKVIGNNNVVGNNLAGNGNAVGNNNRTASTANAPNGFAITGGTVTNPIVNNFGPSGNDEVMTVRVMAVGLINNLERSIANAYQRRATWAELGEKQPDKYPQRIITWHLERITTGFDREYQSEYRAKIVAVREKLEEHIANPPPPFIGPSRYSLYLVEDGIPVPPQRAEAQLYDLCSLLTKMEQENNLPVTFPADSIENKLHSDAASTGAR